MIMNRMATAPAKAPLRIRASGFFIGHLVWLVVVAIKDRTERSQRRFYARERYVVEQDIRFSDLMDLTVIAT